MKWMSVNMFTCPSFAFYQAMVSACLSGKYCLCLWEHGPPLGSFSDRFTTLRWPIDKAKQVRRCVSADGRSFLRRYTSSFLNFHKTLIFFLPGFDQKAVQFVQWKGIRFVCVTKKGAGEIRNFRNVQNLREAQTNILLSVHVFSYKKFGTSA